MGCLIHWQNSCDYTVEKQLLTSENKSSFYVFGSLVEVPMPAKNVLFFLIEKLKVPEIHMSIDRKLESGQSYIFQKFSNNV